MPPTKQDIEEQINHEKAIVQTIVKRLRQLELRAAHDGINTPPEVLTEIDSIRDQIRHHEAEITRLESHPVAAKQLKVLYVEDLPEHAEQYKKVLQNYFGVDQVKHVVTARKALSEIADHPPDVLVADLFIPPGSNYVIPAEAEGLPRIGGNYAYGADICAVALQRGIPIVALSTAPVRHIVREPIEQSRRKYGGTVYHLYKKDVPDDTELISSILQCHAAISEAEALAKELRHWLEDQWSDAPDVSTRLAILNEVHMAIENASRPSRVAFQASPTRELLQGVLASHLPEAGEEQLMVEKISQLLADDATDFTDTSVAHG
jgi:CheY-like chemotaxis protein